jgi:anti-sigma B factor antagonist
MRPPLPQFQVEIVDVPQGKLVRIKGNVNTEEADALRLQLMAALNRRPKLVVFDLADLRFIASAGLGVLAALRRSLLSAGSQGRLAAIPEKLREVMRVAGMTQLYAVFNTVDEALTAP